MSDIIVGFSTAKKFNIFSWAIKTMEKTNYSHCYIKFYSESFDCWLIYHASHTSIHFLSEENFLKKANVLEEYQITIPEEIKKKLVKNAIRRAGILYGAFQILGMGITRIFKLWFNKKICNPFADGEATQVCSDLLYYELKDAINFKDFEPEVDGPRKLHIAIEESPLSTKII
jgi:hypothetical protein